MESENMSLNKQNPIAMRPTEPLPVKKTPPSLTTEEHEKFRELINQCVIDAGLFDDVKRLDAEIDALYMLAEHIEDHSSNIGA
jgi:hypothetical protein